MKRMLAALVLASGLVLVPTIPAAAGPSEDIYAGVNQARWANGQAGLIRNPSMDQVAANWAAQMAASGTMTHNPNYASEIPGGWTAAAENVAQGYASGSSMHQGWMGSSGHRANILGDYTDVGIAFLSSGGTTWGVEVFAKYPGHTGPANPAPPPPPPAPAAPAPAAPAAPDVVATTPADDPAAEATATPTASATPEPRASATATAEETAEVTAASEGAPMWVLVIPVAALLVAGAAAILLVRRRRRAT